MGSLVRHRIDPLQVASIAAHEPSELSRNRLLATLHPSELERFADILRVREFKSGQIVSEPGEPIAEVIFPIDGVFSVVAETQDGTQVEAGTVGNEGVSAPCASRCDALLARAGQRADRRGIRRGGWRASR